MVISMKITRIDTYQDCRFTQKVLYQHGCFLVDGTPYEIEIISDREAVVRGADPQIYTALIEDFRFYTPHITRFYNESLHLIREFPPKKVFSVKLEQIQPSQFYVDEDKIAAISSFIQKPEDIIIQVLPYENRYISLDGHTRLYYAAIMGWEAVRAVTEESDTWVYGFVDEAIKRHIRTPQDLILVSHKEYDEKWNRYCDEFFAKVQTNI